MKLYVSPYSSNSRKARMTAAELGLDPELVVVDLPKREQRGPNFLALNPNGKVPVLVDGDFVLPESHAIMAYLADSTPGQKIYPADVRERAVVNRWLFWSANHWGPTISAINWERSVKKLLGLGDPDAAAVAKSETVFHDLAKVLDEQLGEHAWLAGKGLTLADIAVACPLMVAVPAALPLASYRHVRNWFSRVQDRPSWVKST